MSRKRSTTSLSRRPINTASAQEVDFFGPPPLIPGEERTAYETLWRRVTAAVIPRDVLEEILVREFVDHVWETIRLRRLKAYILRKAFEQQRERYEDSLAKMDDEEVLVVARAFDKLGLLSQTSGTDISETFVGKLDQVERVDRLLASVEARRNNTLREIDHHRATLGAALRAEVEDVEDAEFTDVETGQTRARQ